MKEQENKSRKKGFVQFALIAMVLIVVTEGVIITNYLVRSENIVRAIREEEIIRVINLMEFAKRGLNQAAVYSFNQAAYDIGSRGGYFDLSQGNSLNCIPYWKIFSANNIPSDLESQLSNNILKILNSYGNSLGVDIPAYSTIKFDKENNLMTLTSNWKLQYSEAGFNGFLIKDSANFVQSSDMKIFKMFDAAKEVENDLEPSVSSASSYSNALDGIVSVANSAGKKYSADGIEVIIQPSENLGSSENNFAIRILVSLVDTSGKKFVYDFAQKNSQMSDIQFRYYLLLGNYQVTPETNACPNIKY
jgi:hypothetical protein